MAADPKPGPAEGSPRLADELSWLRALARRLARDAADADDLVQETWLAAQRDRSVEPRARRAWLGGVLRNRDRMLRRGEARRRGRESALADTRTREDIELELHRGRVMSSVQDALRELDEGDRSLLLARYCDGYDAAELGLRLGIPASTVRSRLSRATARVRRNLDERWGGDRRAWAPAALAMPLPRRVEIPIATAWGGVLMSAALKKLAFVLVLVLASAGAWLGIDRSSDDENDPSSVREEPYAADDDAPTRAHRGDVDERRGVVLAGRVVDAESGTPVPGALVLVAPKVGASMVSMNPGRAPVVPRAVANEDGEFTLMLPHGSYALTAAAPGHLPTQVSSALVARAPSAVVIRLREGGNRVEGTVTDITGGPVEGELVRAQPPGDSARGPERAGYGALTDADGRYVLSVPDGAWTLVAGGEDYTRETRRIDVKQGPGRADFTLVPAGSIHGRVVDRASGEPVEDAVVGFNRNVRLGGSWSSDMSTWDETTRTGPDGRFELGPLEPGEYTLHAAASHRATADEPVVLVSIGEQVTDVALAVDPAFDAAGIVVDASDPDHGLADVEVTATAGEGHGQWRAVTRTDGTFELAGLPPGGYLLMLEGGGAIPSLVEHNMRIEGEDVTDLRLSLDHGVLVTGRVEPAVAGSVRVRGRAESGGLEVLVQATQVKHANARIAADGSFSIEGVPPGEWKVVAEGDDGSGGFVDIEVPAEGLADVEVRLEARARVAGVVQDEGGAPLPGLVVSLQAEPDASVRPGPWRKPKTAGSAVSREDGSFEVLGLPPGAFTVAVQDGRMQAVELVDGARVVEPTASAAVDDLVLRVRPPEGRIDGVVRDAAGEPVPDAWVQARADTDGNPRSAKAMATITDTEGRFEIEGLASGSYTVDARGRDADAHGSVSDVEIGRPVTITLEDSGAIEGRVTEGGEPVTRFRIAAGSEERRAVIDPEGAFRVSRLAPGEHTVAVTTGEGSASATVQVESGEIASITLEIAGWGTVAGTVVSAVDGTPLEDVTIEVTSESGLRDAGERMVSAMSGKGGHRTDAEGRFSIDGVGGGRIEVSVSVGSFFVGEEHLGSHAFDLPSGERLDLGEIAVLPPAGVPRAERGSLGMSVASGPTFPVDHGADTDDEHVWITWLEPGGPVERAGLRVGDRIIALDGLDEATLGWRTLQHAFGRSRIRAEQRHVITVEREGAARTVQVRAVASKG
jgi:RNA polymerase sigma factor (sigma-70 family)